MKAKKKKLQKNYNTMLRMGRDEGNKFGKDNENGDIIIFKC